MRPKKVKKVKNMSIFIEKNISRHIAYYIYLYSFKFSCKIIKIEELKNNEVYIYIYGLRRNLWSLNEFSKKKCKKNTFFFYSATYKNFSFDNTKKIR